MNQDRLSFNDLLQEENEYREITPLISFLRIDINSLKGEMVSQLTLQ